MSSILDSIEWGKQARFSNFFSTILHLSSNQIRSHYKQIKVVSSTLETDIGEIEKHYNALHRRIKFNSMIIRRQLLEVGYWNDDLLDENQIITRVRHLIHKDGRLIPVEMRSKRLVDGRYQSFITDISKRIEAEKSLNDSSALDNSITIIKNNLSTNLQELNNETFNFFLSSVFRPLSPDKG